MYWQRNFVSDYRQGVRIHTAKKKTIEKGQIGIKNNATINTVKRIRQLTDYIVFTIYLVNCIMST